MNITLRKSIDNNTKMGTKKLSNKVDFNSSVDVKSPAMLTHKEEPMKIETPPVDEEQSSTSENKFFKFSLIWTSFVAWRGAFFLTFPKKKTFI